VWARIVAHFSVFAIRTTIRPPHRVEFVAGRDPVTAFDPALKVAPGIVKAAFGRGVIGRALPSADTIAF